MFCLLSQTLALQAFSRAVGPRKKARARGCAWACETERVSVRVSNEHCWLASQTALHFAFCLSPKVLPFACLFLFPKNDKHFRGPHKHPHEGAFLFLCNKLCLYKAVFCLLSQTLALQAFSRAVGPRKKARASKHAWACETERVSVRVFNEHCWLASQTALHFNFCLTPKVLLVCSA